MELNDKTEKSSPPLADVTKTPWYGSNTSCQTNGSMSRNEDALTFQSKDPIISIPMQDRKKKKKNEEKRDGGGGGHGPHESGVTHHTSSLSDSSIPSDFRKLNRYLETLMHLFKGNVGSGVFAMGDAVKNAGILVGPCVIVFLGIVCVHCQHTLLSASKKMAQLTGAETPPDFAETVELCFETGPMAMKKMAPYMKKLVNLFLCITQLGFCCVYFVFIATNVKQVMDYYDCQINVHFHMAIVFLPILLSCLIRNLKYLAPLSTIANVFMVIGIVISLYFSAQDLPKISSRNLVSQWNQLPLFFGTALFAFEGIGLVLPLQNEMGKPQHFTKPLGVLNFGMTIVTVIYITMGFMSYLKYGDDIKGSVTLNLPEDDILAQSVKIIISLAILLTYALQFYIPVEILWPPIVETMGPFKHELLMEYAFRTSLVLVTFVLAEAIPYLNLFISLVGAVSSTALALLFPPIVELATSWSISELSPWLVVKDGFIIIVGVLGCVTGTYESINAIVKAFVADR